MSENEQHDDYEPGAWDWVNDQVAAYERSAAGKEPRQRMVDDVSEFARRG